ncbi:MAG: hypothetical protein IT363_12530 [Methanoregulaceae archaeon]|nr:hypothetical protein [Methanoregulaceae archaeon]
MRTNYILVDLENVQPESVEALDHEHCRIVVFVGANQSKISIKLACSLQQCGDRAKYQFISGSGHNNLDFHVAFYLGQLAAEHPGAYFHVVSKDAGFDPLIQHLKSRKIGAARVASTGDIPFVKAATSHTPEQRVQLVVDRLCLPKATRPRTIKTLSSSINAHFQKSLTDAQVTEVIDGLRKRKFVSLVENNVHYEVPLNTA